MTDITRSSAAVPMITNLDRRFEVMYLFGDEYQQVLTLASPPLEMVAEPERALELSRIGSDAMAALCQRYPVRFPTFVGTAPMNHPKGMVSESKRAIEELSAAGMQIYTSINGRPLDHPDFEEFFAYMNEVRKPILLHPARGREIPDYKSENKSEYKIWWTFGWPYETSVAMARLVFSGLLDKYPNLNVITHHTGGMIPFFEGRVGPGWDQMGKRMSDRELGIVKDSLHKAASSILQRILSGYG